MKKPQVFFVGLALFFASLFIPCVAFSQQYVFVGTVKQSEIAVFQPNRFVLGRFVGSTAYADSLTVVARLGDSTQCTIEIVEQSPDSVPLRRGFPIIPMTNATTAVASVTAATMLVRYNVTSGTISLGSSYHHKTVEAVIRSLRSTTAGVTTEAVRVWLYLNPKKRE